MRQQSYLEKAPRLVENAEALLEKTRRNGFEGELYFEERKAMGVLFKGDTLYSSGTSTAEGVSARVVQEGRIGHSNATALCQVDSLLDRALLSASVGKRVGHYPFPPTVKGYPVRLWDPDFARITLNKLTEFSAALTEMVRAHREDLRFTLWLEASSSRVKLLNTKGGRGEFARTLYRVELAVVRPLGDKFAGFRNSVSSGSFSCIDLNAICWETLAPLFLSDKETKVESGYVDVILMPSAFAQLLSTHTCLWNGEMLVRGVTPLRNRVGERISNVPLTLRDDATIDFAARSRPFDVEGVTSQNTYLVKDGVQKGFFHDLLTAKVVGQASTGNAHRDFVGHPRLTFSNLVVSPGNVSFDDAVKAIRKGILIYDITGAGYTNVLSGEFSAKVSLGYKVERGEITGRIGNAVIYGNFLSALQNVLALGNKQSQRWNIQAPFIYFAGLSVTGDV